MRHISELDISIYIGIYTSQSLKSSSEPIRTHEITIYPNNHPSSKYISILQTIVFDNKTEFHILFFTQ